MTGSPSAGGTPPALPTRIIQVFTSPRTLFDRLRERPVWLDILILLVALNVVASLLLPEELIRDVITSGSPEMTEEQLEAAFGVARVFRYLAVATTPLFIAALAGLVILIYNVVMGGEATYRQVFSATAHACVVWTVGGLLALGLALATGELINFTIALLVPGLQEGLLFRILNGINFFTLWTIVVLGIAVGSLYPRRSASSAAMTLLSLYLAGVVGLAALQGLSPA